MAHDHETIRALAAQIAEIGCSDRQNSLRRKWKDHNSLVQNGVPVHVWVSMCPDELVPEEELECESPLLRQYEKTMRLTLYQDSLQDDTIIEPFLVVDAKHTPDLAHRYGFPLITGRELDTRKYHYDPPVRTAEDVDKLVMPDYQIDWDATNAEVDPLRDALGDTLPVVVNTGPMFVAIEGDLSTDMGFLLGNENLLYDVYDEPELLHKLAGALSAAVLKEHAQAEAAGGWRSVSGQNQCITYSRELPDPSASNDAVPKSSLWGFMASQEFTSISPKMFEEFLLPYQQPILEQYGLSSYGCCEDLTRKIDLLRRVKNLRRISVSPFADLPACADTIGKDYVLSWRPNPAALAVPVLDEDAVVQTVKDACGHFKRNANVADITLKDVKTVCRNREHMRRWVELVRGALGDLNF